MKIAVIGGGPAGLRAAEVAARGGAQVTLFDGKASVGRKFLVAGRGGLNLTKAEPAEPFAGHFSGGEERWPSLLADFDGEALRAWAAELGIETFVASTGRVYPRELKAAPLLRRWVQRLRTLGVTFALRHEWVGLTPGAPHSLVFRTPAGSFFAPADAVILALGGGSWPETGSTGAWTALLPALGVAVAPLQAANCGWEVSWPAPLLAAVEGQPLKNLGVRAGARAVSGELLITRYGLEGGALYALGRVLRNQPAPELVLDFKPDLTAAQLTARLGSVHSDLLAAARVRWKLSAAAVALLTHLPGHGPCSTAEALAEEVKHFRLALTGPRPLAEAISSAGGVCWSGLDDQLMLRNLPGVFVAGEMIDWEAPTGAISFTVALPPALALPAAH